MIFSNMPANCSLTPEQARKLLASNSEPLLLLDVRTPEEYAKQHLKGAVLLPLQELETRVNELPGDKPILIYCRSGRRASVAAEILQKKRPDIPNICVLDGFPIY
ncbi:MAG: rhodanese-like domain-containing protein [Desulfovibrionaceae bacterium]|nr:rhodanese-like domain-containing protein [Desulfovibrionaceae bacterium]